MRWESSNKRRRSYGEGSIYEREKDGKRYFVAALSVVENGKRRRREVWCKDETLARKALAKLKTQRARGMRVFSDRLTLAQWLERWQQQRKPNVAPSTFMHYERVIRRYIVPLWGTLRLDSISIQRAAGFYAELRSQKASSATIKRVHIILHKAFNDARGQEVIDRNPFSVIDKPKHRSASIEPYSIQEIRAFLKAAQGDYFEALWIVALFSQARQGELFALRWKDVDLDGGVLYVKRGVQDVSHSRKRIAQPKTESSRRSIELPAVAVEALRKLKDEGRPGELVFADRDGGILRRQNLLRRHLYPLMDKAKLRRIRFHDLRHSGATLLAETIPLVALKERLGHASISTTANIYVHRSRPLGRIAADQLDVLFPSPRKPKRPKKRS